MPQVITDDQIEDVALIAGLYGDETGWLKNNDITRLVRLRGYINSDTGMFGEEHLNALAIDAIRIAIGRGIDREQQLKQRIREILAEQSVMAAVPSVGQAGIDDVARALARQNAALIAMIRGLTEFPPEGERDNKVQKFDGDALAWEVDAGDIGGATDQTARDAADANTRLIETLQTEIEGDRNNIGANTRVSNANLRAIGEITADAWVTTRRLAFGLINNSRFLAGKIITDAHLVDNIINRNILLANNIVEQRNIATDSIERGHMRDDSVGTEELVDDNVTEPKLHQDVRTKLNAMGTAGATPTQVAAIAANTAAQWEGEVYLVPHEIPEDQAAFTLKAFLDRAPGTYPAGARMRINASGRFGDFVNAADEASASIAFTDAQATALVNNASDGLAGGNPRLIVYEADERTQLESLPIYLPIIPPAVKLVRVANEAAFNAITTKDINTIYWWP